MKLSTKEIILLVLISVIDGQSGAKIIYKLADQYLKERRDKKSSDDLNINNSAFRSALSRLKKDGFIDGNKRGFWQATEKGKNLGETLKRKVIYEKFKNNHKNKKFDTIVIFDIPESNRKKRDYLRVELLSLGFSPLQKSVWTGWKPLPIEFLNYIKDMKLIKFMHIFSINNYGTIIN